MTTPPDWPTADRAYQQHHAACPQCRAAGASPNTQQRCPEGAQLWGTYQQAGDPPHFTWLNKRQRGEQSNTAATAGVPSPYCGS